jgi:hypothetical protein
MDITRRQFVQISAAAAGAAAAAASVPLLSGAAAAADRVWLLPHASWADLHNTALGGDPTVCTNAFNQGTTWFMVNYQGQAPPNPIPSGYKGVAVLGFKAYQNGSTGLLDAIRMGLPSWVQAVQYDSEHWDPTPPVEQGAWLYNPHPNFSYAKHFCEAAHSHGLRVVLTPGNDLCNNQPNPAYPNNAPQYPLNPGETAPQAYVRHNLASAAKWLSAGDIFEYQAQPLELHPTTYRSITAEVANQVKAVSSGVHFLAGIGRSGPTWDKATCAQLESAADNVAGVAEGFWPNVDANTTRVSRMICLLRHLGY